MNQLSYITDRFKHELAFQQFEMTHVELVANIQKRLNISNDKLKIPSELFL